MPTYDAARRIVIETVEKLRTSSIPVEKADISSELACAVGRILAQDVISDRNYPPFHRSTRDGYAVRSGDLANLPRALRLIGESKAGTAFQGVAGTGECVQIMTGAPVPNGADAVVMLEYVERRETEQVPEIVFVRPVQSGQNIVPEGSEAQAAQIVLQKGTRLSYSELAMAAQVGQTELSVFRRPHVAILSTGDEVVEIDRVPNESQIRNSNSVSLAAQVMLAGGQPVPLGNAPDDVPALTAMIQRGLKEDALVLSGGVSMGKYDLVEGVLRDLGAEFLFDSVDIRPGRPAVFSICQGKPVFGLPGNPVSTMVTFELFASPAIDILSGATARPIGMFKAKLGSAVNEKPGLAHFLPASAIWHNGEAIVTALPWQGSGDVVTLTKANCFLVVAPPHLTISAGDWVDVFPRRGLF